ncbi:MAG: hypothetical protein SAJ12_13555 [Jaaginema sp. PMC 1079.18]|nr:hypothetical protein [Jaaginema sp. PMC 1080.18]MEC4852009.1 hypothetical protein [Jaaginema sp. PMC 1079.18]MEC4866810.1 hypothetical protein [Jaaginema sp. PMC 1078.18]
MKTVELRELKEQLLAVKQEAIAVEHNGKLLGYFYPIEPESTENDDFALWDCWEQVLDQVGEDATIE